MNDMLIHSWANDYQALQAIDVPMSADTAVAVPELTRLCRELVGSDGKKKSAIEARQKELAEKEKNRRGKWRADAEAKGSQKEISTAWLGLGSGRGDQARRLGAGQRHVQRLDAPAMGFHQAEPVARRQRRRWFGLRSWRARSARLWRSKATASWRWRSNPTATC